MRALWLKPRVWPAAMLVGLAALLLVLRAFPPGAYGFYPECPVHALTGLLCPGCGATRAFAAMAHGEVAEALRWNPLAVGLLPVLGWCAGFGTSRLPAWSLGTVYTLVATFTVWRNL